MSNELKPIYEHFYKEDCMCPRCKNHTRWIVRIREEQRRNKEFDREMISTFRAGFFIALLWLLGVIIFIFSNNAAGDLRQ